MNWRPTEGVRLAGAQFAKEMIWWLAARHRQGDKKNIFLFSSRRSGSTLLMELIAVNRRLRRVAQPLSLYRASPAQLLALPVTAYSQVVQPVREEMERLHSYLSRVLSGDLPVHWPWRFWREDFHLESDRLVLKDLDAKPLIGWIADHFPLSIVYSTRHPIPTALSILRNGWETTTAAYLGCGPFVDQYLSSDQVERCAAIQESGTPLEKHVLNWALENLVPVRLIGTKPEWTYVSYEELLVRPAATIEHLAERLDLPDVDRMRKRLAVPSGSTRRSSTGETREKIEARDSEYLLRRWREKVSAEEEARLLGILDLLGVGIYTVGNDYPDLARIR